MMTMSSSDTPTRSPPNPTNSKQARLREKAEEINLVLLQPDVDLWKLRELALSEGGLVNDTIRRRAWPKLVGLSSYNNNPDDIKAEGSPSQKPNKKLRKGTAPTRVTNFGQNQNGTRLTGGIFDQHDTAATAALQEDDNTSLASFEDDDEGEPVVACMDAEQIERDVTRCTWHLLRGGQRSRRRVMLNKHRKKISTILRRKQRRLGDLINLTLAVSERELDHDRLNYFQGYHDVASIFLAALGGASTKHMEHPSSEQPPATAQAAQMGLELSSKVLYQVSLSHFREPMRCNFLHLQTTMKMVLLPLLHRLDPELHAHLYGCGMEPFFALSWLLAWFSHDIRDTVLVKRLFDFFLVSHPLMPIYLSVAMLCHPSNRQEILATPCEFAELHNVLQGLPKNSSMVGWKWSVGVDGYVSDDEEVGQDGETSISLDSDMASHLSGGQNLKSLQSGSDGFMRREDLILSEGHAHVVSMGIPAHVPFQDLIDTAIEFMGRVPPRKLLGIATRYFDEQQAQPMLELYPSITFFHPPPSWALIATVKADWVLKQRARDQQHRPALTDLRNRKNARENNTTIDKKRQPNADDNECATPELVAKKAKALKYPKAMVAQGFGPGIDQIARQHKRRKILMIGGAATVALFAIGLGFAIQYHGRQLRDPGSKPGDGDFAMEREDAVSYAMKHGAAPTFQPATAPPQCTESDAPGTAVFHADSSLNKANESLIQSYFQKYVVREFQLVYAKLRLLMATLGALNETLTDPEFSNNLQAVLAHVKRSVQDPEVRALIKSGVAKRATQASKAVGRFAGRVFRSTVDQAKASFSGNDLDELGLL